MGGVWFLICGIWWFLWRRQWHPTPVLLPGKSHGWRSLEGCSPWGRWGSDTPEWFHFPFSLSCIGEGNGNPLQCSCLENPRDGGAWWAAIYGAAQSRTRLKRLGGSSSSSGISIPIMADFKLPRWHHWTWNWEGMFRILLRLIRVSSNTPLPLRDCQVSVLPCFSNLNSDLSYWWIVWMTSGGNQCSTILGICENLIKNFSWPWSMTSSWNQGCLFGPLSLLLVQGAVGPCDWDDEVSLALSPNSDFFSLKVPKCWVYFVFFK